MEVMCKIEVKIYCAKLNWVFYSETTEQYIRNVGAGSVGTHVVFSWNFFVLHSLSHS